MLWELWKATPISSRVITVISDLSCVPFLMTSNVWAPSLKLLSIKPMFSWSYSITPRSYLSVIAVSSEATIVYVKLELFSPPNTHHEHHLLSTQFHLPVYSPPTIFYSWPLPLPQHTLSHRCYLDQSLTCTHVLYYSSQCMLTTCGSKWCLMNKCIPLQV